MQKWDYCLLGVHGTTIVWVAMDAQHVGIADKPELMTLVQEMGKGGWEMVGMSPMNAPGVNLGVMLKRPVQTPDPAATPAPAAK